MAGIEIQEPSDSVKVPDLEVQGARMLGNVIAHLHMRIKNSTEVFNKRRTFDFNIIKDEGEMFKVLVVSSRRCDEELCLSGFIISLLATIHVCNSFTQHSSLNNAQAESPGRFGSKVRNNWTSSAYMWYWMECLRITWPIVWDYIHKYTYLAHPFGYFTLLILSKNYEFGTRPGVDSYSHHFGAIDK